jgi:pSer/pThr/pTyr-binding forkhead associated (FHA) protein
VGNDLVFPEGRVSRNHAVLERRGSAIELSDLNSENGTFVNGDRITRRRLAQGDRIRLGGSVELTFEGRG